MKTQFCALFFYLSNHRSFMIQFFLIYNHCGAEGAESWALSLPQ